MARETYVDIKKMIRESSMFASGRPFPIKELSSEIGVSTEFTAQVLGQMVEDGYASKKRVNKNERGGIVWHYRMCGFRPKDFLVMKLRRHSNEQLGLEAEYCWAVL